MPKELKFASENEALQHLANLTGKRIKIANEEIEEEDYVLQDSGSLGSKVSVSQKGGKFLGEFSDEDDALDAIKTKMKKEQFYPTVWKISDHGNVIGPLEI